MRSDNISFFTDWFRTVDEFSSTSSSPHNFPVRIQYFLHPGPPGSRVKQFAQWRWSPALQAGDVSQTFQVPLHSSKRNGLCRLYKSFCTRGAPHRQRVEGEGDRAGQLKQKIKTEIVLESVGVSRWANPGHDVRAVV